MAACCSSKLKLPLFCVLPYVLRGTQMKFNEQIEISKVSKQMHENSQKLQKIITNRPLVFHQSNFLIDLLIYKCMETTINSRLKAH